jgi:hypothetical protein
MEGLFLPNLPLPEVCTTSRSLGEVGKGNSEELLPYYFKTVQASIMQ